MAQERVALVTGGTRGIGAAISKGLKAKGYKVAANYGGNDEAANAFKNETGIDYLEFEVTNESQRDQALRRMIQRGATIVVAVGFGYATPLESIADEAPEPVEATVATSASVLAASEVRFIRRLTRRNCPLWI